MKISFKYRKFLISLLFSLPIITAAKTSYEPNNTLRDAQWIVVNDEAQEHKFDYSGDEDWLVFYAKKGLLYNIDIKPTSEVNDINPAFEIYNKYKIVERELFDFDYFYGGGELLEWNAPESGFFYIRVINKNIEFSVNSHYEIKIFVPYADLSESVVGTVVNSCTGKGLEAIVETETNDDTRADKDHGGKFELRLIPGEYTIKATLEGYKAESKQATVKKKKKKKLGTFKLKPKQGCTSSPIVSDGQLKKQIVANYNDETNRLIVNEVMVEDKVLKVVLKNQENKVEFVSFSAEYIPKAISSRPAFLDIDTRLAKVPCLLYQNKLYSVYFEQQQSDNNIFVIKGDPVRSEDRCSAE